MLGSTIRRELAVMILRDLNDARLVGLPTITRVKVSPDLSIADVYVTVMGTEGQQTAALAAPEARGSNATRCAASFTFMPCASTAMAAMTLSMR